MDARASNHETFPGGGAAGAAIRAVEWERTSLGKPRTWPAALKAHVRAMLHTRQPMSIFWGPDLINLYNDGFVPLLGGKHPAAMGQRADECWKEAWPLVGPQIESVMKGESIFYEEVLVPIEREGRVEDAWWNYSYSPLFDDAGVVGGVLVICTEITTEVVGRLRLEVARREAELARAELHGIFMQSPVPMCLLSGEEHRFVLANEPYRKFVGRDVLGRTLREAFTLEEVGFYLPIMDRVYRTGEPELIREAKLQLEGDPQAAERVIDVGYYPHRDANGSVTGLLGILLDVTAQAAARKQLEQLATQQAIGRRNAEALQQQAEAANRSKDEFLATVSHELRTPLTAMLGWARILADSSDVARLKRGLGIIDRNAQAQAKIIDDILDVSRIVSGKLRLSLSSVDLAQVILAAVESVRPAAAAKQLRLRLDVEPSLRLLADVDRLQQILWNLLSNAVKFTPAGGEVALSASRQGLQIELQVSDTGQGISPSLLPHVFERFRQDDATSTKQHAGLGLGLAIVRHLVELHGGSVSAHSDGAGQGATFEVSLPVRGSQPPEAAEPAGPVAAAQVERPSASRERLVGISVLVVDDQEDARELVATILEDAGARVFLAASARAALHLLGSQAVALIVSDIGMPSEDGYELLTRVRSSPSLQAIPALAVTAFARAEDRDRALASGFQDHIAKPVHPSALVAAVAALVRPR